MKGRTTSAVLTAPETIELREFNIPELTTNSALLSVDLTGVCATDVKVYKGLFREEIHPAILGHEVVATVQEIGDNASAQFGVSVGDRVVVDPLRRCGKCTECIRGEYQFCDRVGGPKSSGVHGYISTKVPPALWGGYGEYIHVDEQSILYPISDDVPAKAAVLAVAIVGNSISWLHAAGSDALQQSLIIQGPGPQGLSMTAVATEMGFSPITVVGVPGDEERLQKAKELGATHTVCREPGDLVDETLDRVGAATTVVNLTGASASVQQSVDLVAENGTIVHASLVGSQPSKVTFDPLVRKNAIIQGVLSRTHSHTMQAIRLLEARPEQFADLVSHEYSVGETDTAIRCAAGLLDDETPLKVAVNPTLDST